MHFNERCELTYFELLPVAAAWDACLRGWLTHTAIPGALDVAKKKKEHIMENTQGLWSSSIQTVQS